MQIRLKKFKIFGSFASLLILGIFLICCSFFLNNRGFAKDSSTISTHFDGSNQPSCCFIHSKSHLTVHELIQKVVTPFGQESANTTLAFAALGLLAVFGITSFKSKLLALYFYYVKHRIINSYNYLIQAFSSGILHPQIYNA